MLVHGRSKHSIHLPASPGLAGLLLSVNNSVPAIAHLCKLTKASHLIYSEKFTKEAHEAQAILKSQEYDLRLVPDQRFPLWGEGGIESAHVKPLAPVLTPEQETNRPAVILHSSGSVISYCMTVRLLNNSS